MTAIQQAICRKEVRAMIRQSALVLATALLLAGCGGKDEPARTANDDAAMSGALGKPLTTDPDLAGENGANTAASVPSADGSVPSLDLSPEAVTAARAAALKLVGGPGAMKQAPAASVTSGPLPQDSQLTAAARAAASPGGQGDCAARASHTASWAAKLPDAFPVYPKAAVQEAAGTDDGACNLRVVNFTTPVPLPEVLDFYYTRATAAGFTAQHARDGGEDVLGGTKGQASYVVYASKLPNGATSVDLVTNGE
jgi:hypothetical protein